MSQSKFVKWQLSYIIIYLFIGYIYLYIYFYVFVWFFFLEESIILIRLSPALFGVGESGVSLTYSNMSNIQLDQCGVVFLFRFCLPCVQIRKHVSDDRSVLAIDELAMFCCNAKKNYILFLCQDCSSSRNFWGSNFYLLRFF